MNARHFCTAAVLFTPLCHSGAQQPLAALKTIPLPGVHGRIDHMAYDPLHGRLFVAALGTDALVVVDLHSGTVTHTITGLAEPQGIGYDPDHDRLWVANGRDGTVRIYNAETFQPTHTISLGDDADNIRREAETGKMLVGYGDGGIAIFDSDARQLANTKLDAHPESFQLEADGPRMFVNLPGSHKIAVIDRNRAQAVATWSTGDARSNFPMALDAADSLLFAVCRTPAAMLAIDTATGQIVDKLATVGDSDDVFYDPALRRIYVSGGEGGISVYQLKDRNHINQIAELATSSGARTSLFVPGLNSLFVARREQGGSPAAIQIFTTQK